MTIEIGHKGKLFNLAEAREHLPLVITITKKYHAKLAPIQARLNRTLSNDPRRAFIEHGYESVVSQWKAKIEQLGPAVEGLWIVGFNVGEGVLSWRYPELSLSYFRAHSDDFKDRVKLKRYIEESDPDWVR